MKLSTKINSGFLGIIGLLTILGVFSFINSNNIKKNTNFLGNTVIQELNIGDTLNTDNWDLMFDMRKYGFTLKERDFTVVEKILERFNKDIEKSKEIINKNKNLEYLREKVNAIDKALDNYKKLIYETHTLVSEELPIVNSNLDSLYLDIYNITKDFLNAKQSDLSKNFNMNNKIETTEDFFIYNNDLKEITSSLNNAQNIFLYLEKSQKNISENNSNSFSNNIKKINDALNILTSNEKDPIHLENLNKISNILEKYKEFGNKHLKIRARITELSSLRTDAGNIIIDLASTLKTSAFNKTISTIDNISVKSNNSLFTITIITILSIIIGIILAFLLSNSITKPIIRAVNELENGSEQVFNASEQLSLASQELAEGSSEQASSIEETSSTLDETSSMVKLNTENTKKAADLTQAAKEVALDGNNKMKEMSIAMHEIKNSSDEISKIIKVIDDIAFQTNILALNAAVEAARAGEAGMGFAVVAEEVRNLAQRSTQAAKDTSEMIEDSIEKSQKGVEIADKVAKALDEISKNSEKVSEIVKEIATASQEQSQGVIQISKAVSQMEQVTQNIASNAEESAAASEQLNSQAKSMKLIVGDLNYLVYGNNKSTNHTNIRSNTTSYKPTKLKSSFKNTELKAEDVIPLEDDPLDF
ncbi:methyl-accepting chemotaxis protein/methyl-accepting chemotaxis protein-2 (aspartate sensor receptor) [Hypnocyclicus thermotrophus]|uniref:Methyl-accepting chemotaxis protein/methyl-accepting chemotaxis protein-2 (Aspartate sensor receptor) n=1 Tax=Hypnocyclicus thermotrophus TaxID=1627895 RepID=A0AA46E0N2_9FUSO|nr:methyl-accepting chemotaxis protein [Hypnocyclicus thermotrophus]TDT72333.1 methyl-accepting chemotaxis protein/methyl-accepting chemotaxis protein-2 (aspartate sensor receptor) [Hypnocyclicus thermotrophus]